MVTRVSRGSTLKLMASTENEGREIESERETAYLLKSETMRRRLLDAMDHQEGLPLEAVIEKLGI
jgi:hypothetical protein